MKGVKIIKVNCSYEDLIKNCTRIGHGASKITYKSKDGSFVLKVPKVGKYKSLYEMLENPCYIPQDSCELGDVADALCVYDLAPIYGQFYAELFYYNQILELSAKDRHFARLLKMLAKTYCAYLTEEGILVIKQEIADKCCDNIPSGPWCVGGYYNARNKVSQIENANEREYFWDLIDRASNKCFEKRWGAQNAKIKTFFNVLKNINDYVESFDSDLNVWDINRRNTGYFNNEIKIFDYGIIGCFDINNYDTYVCDEEDGHFGEDYSYNYDSNVW